MGLKRRQSVSRFKPGRWQAKSQIRSGGGAPGGIEVEEVGCSGAVEEVLVVGAKEGEFFTSASGESDEVWMEI